MTSSNFRGLNFATMAFAATLFCLSAARLDAVIVGTGDGTGNNTAPTDALGDPGWANVGSGPYSNVYLGNGWVLEAYHCHTASGSSDYAIINGQTYNGIAGSGFRLTDPTTHAGADLYMYRISGSPGLNSLAISATAPTFGATVRAIGSGADRVTGTVPTLWDANWNVLPPGTPNPAYTGFPFSGTYSKRWGDNQIAGTPVTINAGYGDTNALYSIFDKNGITNEFQLAPGDSGGGLFYKSSGYWQLTGILDARGAQKPDGNAAVFGDASYAANLAYYRSQIVAAVQVFQISGPVLANPGVAMGTGWQSVQLIGNGGFGASTGSWSIPVDTNGFIFTIDTGANTVSMSSAAAITGGGSLTKLGTGTLSLLGTDTYSGQTLVNAGTLAVSKPDSLPGYAAAGKIVVSGSAALQVNAGGATDWQTSNIQSLLANATFNTGSFLAIDTTNGNFSYGNAIGGNFGLTKLGSNTLTLLGSNSYTGTTKVNGGKLQVKTPASLPSYATAGKVVVASGATLQVNVGGTGEWQAADVQSLAANANFTSGSNLTLDATDGDFLYDGALGGSFNLIKTGGGTLTLSAAAAYTGNTVVSAGVVQLAGGNNRLPTSTALSLANSAGTALNVNNFMQTVGSLSGGGTVGGNVTLGGGTLIVGNTASTTYAGAISGAGGTLIKNGTGTLTLTGNNSYTGPTKLSAGTLVFSQSALSTTSQLTFTGNSTLKWNAHNQALSGRLAINDGVTATLDTNGNNVAFSQPLNFGAARTGSLVKTGGGVLTITGPMSFAGDTTVSGGTLALSTLETPGETVSVLGAGSLLTATSITADKLRIDSTGAASSLSPPAAPLSIATVPEPTTLALLIVGLLSVGTVFFRNR